MEFIDLAAQQLRIREAIETRIQSVLTHGKYIMGPEVKELEERLANYVGVKHAIGCASGTDALLLALMAYDVGEGDAIFTTPFTFISTSEVISLLGAIPIFVDIDPVTFNLDPAKLEQAVLAVKSNDKSLYLLPRHDSLPTPKGIIPVDLFGLPADYDAINAIAQEHDLLVIQDGAQSFGAEHKGRRSCSQGNVACTSFFPAKPLGCYGDGGMCFTDNDDLAHHIDSLRLHGKGHHKYDNACIGINGRLDTLQAAILLAKFDIFPEEVELRRSVSGNYSDSLTAMKDQLKLPFIPEGYKSVWAQYSVLAKDEEHRSILQAKLKEDGIPTAIYYPRPLHLQTAFSYLGYKERDFPISEDCASRIFSLPMHPYVKAEDRERIAQAIEKHEI